MSKLFASLLALSAALTQSGLTKAHAADIAAPKTTANNMQWSGFYTGLSIGAGLSRFAWDSQPTFVGVVAGGNPTLNFTTTPFATAFKSTRALSGLQIGHLWTSGQIAFGMEADLNSTSYRTGNFIPLPPPAPNVTAFAINGSPTDLLGAKVNYTASLRARLGLIATPDLLIYGTTGLALANVTATGSYIGRIGIGSPAATYQQTALMSGWSAGFGADYALNRNWSLGGEYLYANYGHKSFQLGSLTNNPSGRIWAINNVIGLTASSLTLKLNYRF